MSTTVTATPPLMKSYFLDLPPELRSIIYTHLIVEDEPIESYRELVCKPEHASALPGPVSTSYTTSLLPSTCFLRYEYIIRPQFPAIASVSQLIHDEVLPLYFSGNKFTIRVAHGHLGSTPFPWNSVDEWRQHLGPYARHLRDVTIVTHNLHVGPCALWTPFNDLLATRAMLREDGTMVFGLAACQKYFCVCGLRSATREQLGRDKKDGRQLLIALEDWIDDAVYGFEYSPRSIEHCGECKLLQLTHATDEWPEGVRGFIGFCGGGAWA